MLIKLNKLNRGVVHYEPPFEVVRNFDDIDREAPVNDQIDGLLWIPALLVCRFLYQFPLLKSEADELFSIGLVTVVDEVNNSNHPGHKIGAVIHTNACAMMERYCNSLNSVISVSTFTRYKNRNAGKDTPENVRLTHQATVEDDLSELYIQDAVEVLGIDLEKASLDERRKLAQTLGLEEYL